MSDGGAGGADLLCLRGVGRALGVAGGEAPAKCGHPYAPVIPYRHSSVEVVGLESGIVLWYNPEKGFGLIERENGEDVFVEYSDISGGGYRTLSKGDPVLFEVVQADRGPKAVNVTRHT